MSEELKPCPFCGQQDAFVEQLDSDASVVICQGMVDEHSACLARGPVGVQQSDLEDQPGRDAAIAEWNRRAQLAEAEVVGNARLMNTLAELARRAPLRTLQTICETQHQVSTVKLERYLEPIGDTLAGYAFTLRIDFDKLSAALSAVTAERDRLLASKLYWVAPAGSGLVRCVTDERYRKFSPSIRAKYDPVCCVDAAMAAKEE